MSIQANVTNQQITASVSESQIDVSVGGGVGPTGTAGAAATVAVGTVTTGAPGSSAAVVNAGSSSAAVLNFTIPAGADGAAGAAGSQGPAGAAGATGAAGAAATIAVGTVTTGAPGSSASVTNSGTSSAAVLDFAIPAGAAGANGAAGATGPAGSSGVISVTAPLTNSGTSSSAALALSTGTGLTVSGGNLVVTYGTSTGTACEGNDARLSDSRTPTSHASTHQTGGADAIANVVNSPAQITSNQNDYALPSADVVRITSDAAREITGFVAGADGRAVLLLNVGSHAITLKHQSASSTAANRIVVPWANDFVIAVDGSATLVYDDTTDRWRVL